MNLAYDVTDHVKYILANMMLKTAPISVVIPTFNGERFITETIKSVQAQTVSVDEIIVVDNNSTDNSRRIAENLGAKVITQKKQGTPCARNLGIKESKNDWIALLDQDDLWEKEKIEYQWKAIELFPAARFIGCEYSIFWQEAGRKVSATKGRKPEDDSEIKSEEYKKNEISFVKKVTADNYYWFYTPTSASLLHWEAFLSAGGFNEEIAFCDEVEFFLRVMRKVSVAKVIKDLVVYRRHDQNHSLDEERSYSNFLKMTEMMLKHPDKYPPGMGGIYRQMVIDHFVHTGKIKAKDIADLKAAKKHSI